MTWTQNTAFSQVTPKLQLAWDSVSLGALKTCPRYYELAIVHGYTPHQRAVDLDFGIWMHAARERYYHARAEGQSHDDGVDRALDYILRATWDNARKRPWLSDHSTKNRFTLARSIVWYCDHWRDDPLQTLILANGKPAVELSFRFETDHKSTAGETFMLSGHLDRVGIMSGKTYLSDLKTTGHTLTSDYYNQFTPDNQMSLYSFAAKVVYSLPVGNIIIDAVQVAVTFSRFDRGMVQRTPEQLDEWYEDLGVWLRMAESYALANHWPMNEKACWRCDFRGVCAKPRSVRDQWLRAGFATRMWNPLIARGDI